MFLRGSTLIQCKSNNAPLEAQSGFLQILWPTRILRKVNKRLHEDKLYAESELQVLRYFPKMHPMVKRELAPIVLSSILPAKFADFVPTPDA